MQAPRYARAGTTRGLALTINTNRSVSAGRNAVEVQIARLRKKLGSGYIQTVRGLGYRFVADQPGEAPDQADRQPCRSGGKD